MGTLYYGASRTAVRIDDRMLAHLRVVAVSKLRRNESFMLTWLEPNDHGDGRAAIWVHPSTDLIFRFDGGHNPDIDKELLEKLSYEAMSPTGVQISAEMPRFWTQA